MAVPLERIVRIVALQLAKLCEPDAPPQPLADYATEVGQGGTRAMPGAERGLATWLETHA